MRLSRFSTFWGGYPLAIASVVVITALLLPLRTVLDPAQVMLIFVPLAAWIGRAAGPGPAVAWTAAGVVFVALFFVLPYDSIVPASATDQVTLALFAVVTLFVGVLAGNLRTRARVALQRQREIGLLNQLSSRLVSEKSVREMAAFIVNDVVTVFGAARSALYLRADGHTTLLAEAGESSSGLQECAFADHVVKSGTALGVGIPEDHEVAADPSDIVEEGSGLPATPDGAYIPMRDPEGIQGVLYVRPLARARELQGQSRQLVAVADLAAAFLVRCRLEDAAALARATRESDRLKNTLVSSVSHELKTPLAAVTARVTGMLEEPAPIDDARVRAELTAVSDDLGRLDSSIRDLVDVSRLESDSWRPRLDTYEIGEVLATVASRLPVAQRPRVVFEIPPGLPAVRIDFAQMSRAISNLVGNALAYAPHGEPVRVGARVLGRELIVWVEDHGPGVPEEEKAQVFEKFFRGSASGASPAGTGLGLAIVREVMRSHGGRAWVEDAVPTGARFVVSMPVENQARA